MAPIETRVESVTLYHRGATVRRVAEVDCGADAPAEVHVVGLPLALLDHTVRARFETEALVLSNVRVGLHAPPRATPERPPEQKELRENAKAIALHQGRLAQIENELTRLRGFPVLPRPAPEEGKLPTASPMPARFALEQLADDAVAARVKEARALREALKALEDQAAALRRKIQLASTATNVKPDELTKSVLATVRAKGAAPAKAKLVIEYFVVGARWAPAYQCRMSRDCRQADVQLRAMVAQKTGEDWNGARLLLSTASPMSWTELPELAAIKIGKAQPPPAEKRGFRPPPIGADTLFTDFDRGLTQARAAMPVIPQWHPPHLALAAAVPVPRPHVSDESLAMPAEAEEEMDEAPAPAPPPPPAKAAMMRPPASMPPPAPMPMPAMASIGFAGGAMAAGPAAKEMKKRAAPPHRSRAEMERGLADVDDAPDGGPGAGGAIDVMIYASLRLSAAFDVALRGKLKPVDRRQAYVESLTALKLTAAFDVLAVVEAAEASGAQVFKLGAPAGTADVRAAAGFYDYVYRTDAAVDVPSDGTFHSIPVGARTASGDVLYVTVPREDPLVYRQAMVKNPLPSPLLPGPVEVYVAGEYVLTTTLPSVAPGGDFKLSLGVEQAIKVARNTKYREQRSGEKVVATNELIHEIAIELVNNLDREVACEVRERVPQPAEGAEVVVEEGPITPAWDPYKQEERGSVVEGGRRWRVSVKPGATQGLAAHYRVKLYANNELIGGNRREA